MPGSGELPRITRRGMPRARRAQGGASPTRARVGYEAKLCRRCDGELGGRSQSGLRMRPSTSVNSETNGPRRLFRSHKAWRAEEVPPCSSATLTGSFNLGLISSYNGAFMLRWCLTLTGPLSVRWRRHVRNRPVSIVSKMLYEQYQEGLAYDGQPIWG